MVASTNYQQQSNCKLMSTQDLSLDSLQSTQNDNFCHKTGEIGKIGREHAVSLQNPENGRFAVGNPGGPGRPPLASPTAAYRRLLAERGADELVKTVYNDALTAKSARDRLAAASEITDRVDGKATQRMDVRGLICMMPAEAVMSSLDKWAGDDE